MQLPGFRIDWSTTSGALLAVEPRLDEVVTHAAELAAAYNDPHNAPLLGHADPLSETEVVDHYESMLDAGAHAFLLYCDGQLAGDADLRGFDGGAAEFAFMIGAPAAQGKGLGTRFALMVHAYAFGQLGLATVYASIVPANTASRRVFDKLGYTIDASPAARAFADDPGDVTMAIDRATFERLHAVAVAEIRIAVR